MSATTIEELQILITSETSGLKKELKTVREQLHHTNTDVKRTTESIGGQLKKLAGILAGVFAVKKITDFGRETVNAYSSVQVEAAKLERVMRNTMDATDGQIEAIKQLAAAQQDIGVIGADIQYSGMQELGTYLSQANSLKTLLPTLNDMLAQQYGLDATHESAVNIATMIGKVMDGQLGALSRYGYSWTEAQEKVLKFGNEAERAATLAEVVAESVGGMNEALARTPSGQMRQLSFTLGAIKEEIGKGLQPVIMAVLPYVHALANAILRVVQYFNALVSAIFGLSKAQANLGDAANGAAKAQTGIGDAAESAGNKAKKAGKEAKGAVAGFDEINTLVDLSTSGKDESEIDGIGGVGDIPDFQLPDIDLNSIPEEIQKMVDDVKSIFDDYWNDLSEYVGRVAEAWVGIVPAMQPIIDAKEPIEAALMDIGDTFLALLDNVLKPVTDYFLMDFLPSIVTGIVKTFAPVFADVAVWAVELFAKTFKNATAILTNLWNTVWFPAAEQLKKGFLDNLPLIASAFQTLLNGTIKPFVDFILNGFIIPIAAAIQRTFVPIFTDIAVWAFREFAKTFEWAANMLNSVYQSVIQPVFELIKTIVLDTLEIITGLWDEYGQVLLDNLSELFESIRETFQLLWDEILEPIITPFLEMLSWLWESHLKAMVEEVGRFVIKLINAALEIYNKFITPIVNYLIKTLGPTFSNIFTFVVDIVGTAIATISDIIKSLLKILGGLIDFIAGVFTGNWKKAWEGVKDVFKGIVELISGIFKGVLNATIDVINFAVRSVINAINDMIQGTISLINMVPGVNISLSPIPVPQIPKLARGGIVDSPTLAMIGEAGKEAVVPLENTSFVNNLASALGSAVMAAMQMSGGNQQSAQGYGDIVIMMDTTEVARVINPALQREQQRIGATVIQPL